MERLKTKGTLFRVFAFLLAAFTAIMPYSSISFAAEAGTDMYTVTVTDTEHGTVSLPNGEEYAEGDEVTLDIEPEDGYELQSVTVAETGSGDTVAEADEADTGELSFTMPAVDVTATAVFTEMDIGSDSKSEPSTDSSDEEETETEPESEDETEISISTMATVSSTVYNKGDDYLSDELDGVTYSSVLAWLSKHHDDNYYLNTPYPETDDGTLILGLYGGTDRRNPNGDCSGTNGVDDTTGVAMMNCTGFVWHVLYKASGMSYNEALNTIPCWGSVGAGAWKAWLRSHDVEYKTYYVSSATYLNDLIEAVCTDGYASPGDLIWTWDSSLEMASDGLPAAGESSDYNHIGIYIGNYFGDGDNTWWDSIGYSPLTKTYYNANLISEITPKTSCMAITVIKLDESTGDLTLKKSSSDTTVTSGNSNYSLAGAVYGVYSSTSDASADSNRLATLTTTSDGSTNTVELEAGIYYVKEVTASPGYKLDTETYSVTVTTDNGEDNPAVVTSTEVPDEAKLYVHKESGNTGITNNNSCYSLAGATYGVYTSSSCTEDSLKWTLTTDENGDTETIEIPFGTYYVKEIEASPGYGLDETIYPVTAATADQTYTVNSEEPPLNDPAGITLYKIDQETGDFTTQGGATLAGAQFTITHYAGFYTEDEIEAGKPEEDGVEVRTWVVETQEIDGEYILFLDDTFLVSGDDWYYNDEGGICLPLGTITIKETKAPTGYLLSGGYFTYTDESGNTVTLEDTYYTQVLQEGDAAYLDGGNEYTQSDIPIRGDFEFTKKDSSYGNMANVKFSITSNTTGESHIIWTDENGYYSTSSDYILHSENTNSDEPGSGIWFGLDSEGNNVEVDDEEGALPYDTYTVEELRCDANEGKSLRTFTVTVSRDGFLIDMGTIVDTDVSVETTATDSETGSHFANADGEITIEDEVFYDVAEKGSYTVKGILMDQSTGAALLDADGNEITSEVTFNAKSLSGTVTVEFTFDASLMEGTSVVAFEYLYDAEGELIAEHTDIEDEDQTVYFPEIGTTALDDETASHISNADEEVSITDTIEYTGLESIAGEEVTVTGTLMDKETGEALLDDDGNEITSEGTFTVDESGEGTFEITFTFSGTSLEGKTAVAFESVEYKNLTVATHMDIDDKGQTIYFPKVRTQAEDSETGTNVALADSETTIIDHVTVSNLVIGEEYTLNGVLMDQSTGEALLDADGNEITSEVTFTADSTDDVIDMEFTFDSTLLAGTTVVVFEDLLYNGKIVGTHSDINSETQAVTFPGIGTTATDASDGDKKITASEDVTINDVVDYTGLTPDVQYKMVLTVMDKTTGEALLVDGKEVTAELEFVPEESDGSVTVPVTFDASALSDGDELVMFEKCYMLDNDGNWAEVANHEDLDDEGQTVTVTKTDTSVISTGDGSYPAMAGVAGCIAAAGIAGVLVHRKRRLF